MKTADDQPTIIAAFNQQKQWTNSDERAVRVSEAIMTMMAYDAEPFYLVEREGFRHLMNTVAPKYKIPSRKYFKETLLQSMYDRTKEKVENIGTHSCEVC